MYFSETGAIQVKIFLFDGILNTEQIGTILLQYWWNKTVYAFNVITTDKL